MKTTSRKKSSPAKAVRVGIVFDSGAPAGFFVVSTSRVEAVRVKSVDDPQPIMAATMRMGRDGEMTEFFDYSTWKPASEWPDPKEAK